MVFPYEGMEKSNIAEKRMSLQYLHSTASTSGYIGELTYLTEENNEELFFSHVVDLIGT